MNHKNSIFKIQFPYLGQGIFIDRQNIFTDKFFDGNKTPKHDSSSILRPQPVKRPVSVGCVTRGALGDGFFRATGHKVSHSIIWENYRSNVYDEANLNGFLSWRTCPGLLDCSTG